MTVPVLVREEVMQGTGYFPAGREQAYLCERDGLSLALDAAAAEPRVACSTVRCADLGVKGWSARPRCRPVTCGPPCGPSPAERARSLRDRRASLGAASQGPAAEVRGHERLLPPRGRSVRHVRL